MSTPVLFAGQQHQAVDPSDSLSLSLYLLLLSRLSIEPSITVTRRSRGAPLIR